MVKHVYYKKQPTSCTWHSLSKMEKGRALSVRREQQQKRRAQVRKDQLMINYVNIKHPLVYKEAEQYYTKLNHLYPNKLNLQKTPRFKELTRDPVIKDNLNLSILLMPQQTVHVAEVPNPPTLEVAEVPNPPTLEVAEVPNPPALEVATNCHRIASELSPDLQTIDEYILPELPPGIIQGIIEELRADPNLRDIMKEVEATIENEPTVSIDDEDIDINIDIDTDLLEKELFHW